jgi:hypothetical protein
LIFSNEIDSLFKTAISFITARGKPPSIFKLYASSRVHLRLNYNSLISCSLHVNHGYLRA